MSLGPAPRWLGELQCQPRLEVPDYAIATVLEPDPLREPTPGDWIAIDPSHPASPAILYAMSGPFPPTPRIEPKAWLVACLTTVGWN
jgi:hypothetical protein